MKKILLVLPLALVLVGCGNAGMGNHVGYITSVENVGWPTQKPIVYVKSDLASSQEDKYCADPYVVKALQNAAESRERVKLTYRVELIAAPWRCDVGDTFITQVETIK